MWIFGIFRRKTNLETEWNPPTFDLKKLNPCLSCLFRAKSFIASRVVCSASQGLPFKKNSHKNNLKTATFKKKTLPIPFLKGLFSGFLFASFSEVKITNSVYSETISISEKLIQHIIPLGGGWFLACHVVHCCALTWVSTQVTPLCHEDTLQRKQNCLSSTVDLCSCRDEFCCKLTHAHIRTCIYICTYVSNCIYV